MLEAPPETGAFLFFGRLVIRDSAFVIREEIQVLAHLGSCLLLSLSCAHVSNGQDASNFIAKVGEGRIGRGRGGQSRAPATGDDVAQKSQFDNAFDGGSGLVLVSINAASAHAGVPRAAACAV